MKWKQLYEMKKQKLEALEREMKLEEDKLIAQRESQREQTKAMWEQREANMGQMFEAEQKRRTEEEMMMMDRMKKQEDGMRKRQEENSLFMQAQELNNMLDQNERTPWGPPGGRGGMAGGRGGMNM